MSVAAATRRGALVVFEGLDRAGKSSQCARLVENLSRRGHQVLALRFPDRTTPIGSMIDHYLSADHAHDDHVIHLLFSANRWEAAGTIRDALAGGVTVVVDRYYYSGMVYSAAKQNPGLSLQWARKPDEGLPRPDLCIFLDVSPNIAEQRGGFGAERYEKKEMQDRVGALFARLLQNGDQEQLDMTRLDGGRPFEDVESDVLEIALAKMSALDGPLRTIEPWE